MLWFFEELGRIPWGCPFCDALLEPPHAGFALCPALHPGALQPGKPALPRPGHSALLPAWPTQDMGAGGFELLLISTILSAPLYHVSSLCPRQLPCLLYKKKNHFFGASSACLGKKLEGHFLCLENQGCIFPEVIVLLAPGEEQLVFRGKVP